MKLRYNRRATERYTAVLVELTEQNPVAALRFFNKVEAALVRLQHFPMLGSFTREYGHLSVRQIIVEPYRFFYIVDERRHIVWIVDVWHGAQMPDEPQLPAP
jgi:toxin ParE1/3/4